MLIETVNLNVWSKCDVACRWLTRALTAGDNAAARQTEWASPKRVRHDVFSGHDELEEAANDGWFPE